MIYPIVAYGHHVLRERAQAVALDTDLQAFVADMFDTMDQAGGVGLAAPQIGKSWRLFVADLRVFADPNVQADGLRKAYINPKLRVQDATVQYEEEGCLSIPGVQIKVPRPKEVCIMYTALDGSSRQEILHDLPARVIQHEYDHLDGKLCIDYATPLQRQILQSKLAKIKMGKVEVPYRMHFAKQSMRSATCTASE